MATPFEILSEKFAALAELRARTIERLQSIKGANEIQFDLSKPAPGVERSLVEIDTRVMTICELASDIRSDTNTLMIPQSYVNSLIKPIDQLTALYQTIADNLTNIDNDGGAGNLDPTSHTLRSKNGQINLQLGGIFQNIWSHSETILGSIFPLLNLVRGKGQADFSAALHTFNKALEQVHASLAQLSNVTKEARADRRKIADLLALSGPRRDEIERLKTESEKDRKTLAEYTSEGTQSITSIRATTEQAEKLRAAVDKYTATFDSFQEELGQREQTIQQGNERQGELLQSLVETEKKIQGLNQRAEAMLSGATVAGLAGSFGKLRDNLSTELGKARWVFYLAIALLFLSVIPLAAYVIPGLGELLSLSSAAAHAPTASTPDLIGQILARALLLLPAAWFAKFAAGRHVALFRLREHYAYKYSVASSVEGFKQQAAPFKDAIAATTFFELTFNPADRMDAKGQGDRHPSPAMEWIMKKLGTTYEGKG